MSVWAANSNESDRQTPDQKKNPTTKIFTKFNILHALFSLPDCFYRINILRSFKFGIEYELIAKQTTPTIYRKNKKIMENQYLIRVWETKFKLNLRFCFRKAASSLNRFSRSQFSSRNNLHQFVCWQCHFEFFSPLAYEVPGKTHYFVTVN